jgi:hypothetical protein
VYSPAAVRDTLDTFPLALISLSVLAVETAPVVSLVPSKFTHARAE